MEEDEQLPQRPWHGLVDGLYRVEAVWDHVGTGRVVVSVYEPCGRRVNMRLFTGCYVTSPTEEQKNAWADYAVDVADWIANGRQDRFGGDGVELGRGDAPV